jgi:hypothetical protein
LNDLGPAAVESVLDPDAPDRRGVDPGDLSRVKAEILDHD